MDLTQPEPPSPQTQPAPAGEPPKADASAREGRGRFCLNPSIAAAAENDARIVLELLMPGYLPAIVGEGASAACAVRAFEIFMERAGSPTDPIERSLLEQHFLTHHRLAQLQVAAHTAKSLEARKVYNAAAVRLLGEFRRMAMTIRAYRQPPATRNFNLIHQQNVATAGSQQDVQYVNGKPVKGTASGKADEDLRAVREHRARDGQVTGPVAAGA